MRRPLQEQGELFENSLNLTPISTSQQPSDATENNIFSQPSSISEIYELFPNPTVLLPVPRRQKGCRIPGWQNTSFEESQSPEWQRKLEGHGNMGVLLGPPSSNLITIDCDDEDFRQLLLDLNPVFANTLRSKGYRGENLWLYMRGEYPAKFDFVGPDGNHLGEWRSHHHQTIIRGIHPDSNAPYQITNKAEPLTTNFQSITFPFPINDKNGYKSHKITKPRNRSKESPPPSPPSSLAAKIKMSEKAARDLARHPNLAPLYKRFIANIYSPRQGERNAQLIKLVPFLAHNVSIKFARELSDYFYKLNAEIFTDSFEQHKRESESHLEAVIQRWKTSLNNSEKMALEGLNEPHLSAARICRNLSQLENEDVKPPEFFLSNSELALRLGVDPKTARKILASFEAHKILEVVVPGTAHSKEGRGKATIYRWIASST
ncbi:bifunctional DNA primase/polymerase [Roseibacillus persicicus]|nr:bifunctional DNA primase/polymerase [Roseibacillus persicicus]